ncbi:DUF6934 family protein [Dyadobacter fanqingshengii]|uniref:Uncharacterized protein n=1 Tax=Dyadobacter fanqingshengii TaxID=2906443 RepID=A0A9X1P9F7_9BACT|nr:hypothetical protein [Dyadobacter fanqingshengii]MCF0040457.1 hypothetical protein [Dyadobacter fanqingshengii]USJ37801.1 hypothetical protein NFI81_08445 [Dyadobacter fanqingshengii]
MSVSSYDTIRVSADAYGDSFAGIEILDSHKFYSEGKNGKFELRTFITRVKDDPEKGLFNLGFGAWDEVRQIVDDRLRTRNDDMKQILGTVAAIALDFLKKYPVAHLYAEGSTFARTRLYQREISKILEELPIDLQLHGLIRKEDIGFIEFRKGIHFDGFLLSVRNS